MNQLERWCRRGATWLALSICGTALSSCYAEARTGAVVEAEYVPAHVDVYPSEYYDGHVVYLIGDRWYYQSGPHWVYYRSEPTVLVQRRTVIRRAPAAHRAPAVRQRRVVHEAPPARERGRAERRQPQRY